MKKAILIIILVAAIAAFVVSGYKLISSLNEYKEGETTYQSISSEYVTLTSSFVIPEIPKEKATPEIEAPKPLTVDFKALKEYNPDIVGWIYCPDTSINYPVLQASDNDYYLRRMADRKYNIAGSIFMDYRSNPDLSGINALIYGHNMKNSTMFSDIVSYDTNNPEYFNSHPYIYYFTEEQNYILQIIGEKTAETNDSIFKDFESKEEMQEYLTGCTPMILFNKEYDISSIDNLVTLSTCSKNSSEKRQLLFCVPIKITE